MEVTLARKPRKRRRTKRVKRLTWQRFASVYLKRMDHLFGDGPFALITLCRDEAYSLHETLEGAEKDLQRVSKGCGGGCVYWDVETYHFIVDLREVVPNA